METITQWIFDNYPWLAPTIVSGYVIWKISGWAKDISHMLKSHEDSLSKLDKSLSAMNSRPCDVHDMRISNSEKEIRNANERIDGILMGMSMGVTGSSRKRSPYTLTEFGEYVLAESHGKDCVDQNRDFLFGRIESGLHSTPFDVERGSLRAVWDLFFTDRADAVKDYIYNAPDTVEVLGKEYKLTQNDVQVAMAIYLRDLYLDAHPAIGK